MKIEFISDYVCPYCLVAKEALKVALKETGIHADIEFLPFQLTEAPKERVDTYHDETRKAHYRILIEPCKKLGLDMKLPPNVVPRPYTHKAYEGWLYACDHGLGEKWNDLMYEAYFIDEKDIGDVSVLAVLATSLGMDGADFEAAMNANRYAEAEKAAIRATRERFEIRGVPSIYVDGRKIQLHDYSVEEMVSILNEMDSPNDEGGFCCGPDGCA